MQDGGEAGGGVARETFGDSMLSAELDSELSLMTLKSQPEANLE